MMCHNLTTKLIAVASFILFLPVTFSCDDGRIYDEASFQEEGAAVQLTAQLTGTGNWPEGYSIAIAGFSPTDNYAIISKVIGDVESDGTLNVQLTGIPSNVETIEICALNRLRQRVTSFSSHPLEARRDTTRINAGELDVSVVNAIQTTLLNTSCIACHGATGGKAAGLDLTATHFYDAVVNQPSKKVSSLSIVEPYNPTQSVLHLILHTDISDTWRQNHADMINRDRTANILSLVEAWIANGATN